MINTTRGPQPLDMQYASRLVEEGRRFMDIAQGIDQTPVDKNDVLGLAQLDTPTQHGINHFNARFEGDRYNGSIEVNDDQRGLGLDRKYEFKDNEGQVIITQQLPSYGEVRYDRFVVDTRYYKATVEHVWEHNYSA